MKKCAICSQPVSAESARFLSCFHFVCLEHPVGTDLACRLCSSGTNAQLTSLAKRSATAAGLVISDERFRSEPNSQPENVLLAHLPAKSVDLFGETDLAERTAAAYRFAAREQNDEHFALAACSDCSLIMKGFAFAKGWRAEDILNDSKNEIFGRFIRCGRPQWYWVLARAFLLKSEELSDRQEILDNFMAAYGVQVQPLVFNETRATLAQKLEIAADVVLSLDWIRANQLEKVVGSVERARRNAEESRHQKYRALPTTLMSAPPPMHPAPPVVPPELFQAALRAAALAGIQIDQQHQQQSSEIDAVARYHTAPQTQPQGPLFQRVQTQQLYYPRPPNAQPAYVPPAAASLQPLPPQQRAYYLPHPAVQQPAYQAAPMMVPVTAAPPTQHLARAPTRVPQYVDTSSQQIVTKPSAHDVQRIPTVPYNDPAQAHLLASMGSSSAQPATAASATTAGAPQSPQRREPAGDPSATVFRRQKRSKEHFTITIYPAGFEAPEQALSISTSFKGIDVMPSSNRYRVQLNSFVSPVTGKGKFSKNCDTLFEAIWVYEIALVISDAPALHVQTKNGNKDLLQEVLHFIAGEFDFYLQLGVMTLQMLLGKALDKKFPEHPQCTAQAVENFLKMDPRPRNVQGTALAATVPSYLTYLEPGHTLYSATNAPLSEEATTLLNDLRTGYQKGLSFSMQGRSIHDLRVLPPVPVYSIIMTKGEIADTQSPT